MQPRCRGLNACSVLLGQARRFAVVVSPWARVAPTMLAGTRLGASGSRGGSRALAARGTVLCVGPRQRSWAGCASAPLKKSQTSRFSVGAQTGPTRLGNAQHAKASTGHGARHAATAGELLPTTERPLADPILSMSSIPRIILVQRRPIPFAPGRDGGGNELFDWVSRGFTSAVGSGVGVAERTGV